jgi:hypothetical protein
MQQNTVTIVVAAFGFSSTLLAAFVGQKMSRSWQREQWMLDNKKKEYSELLAVFSAAYISTVNLHRHGSVNTSAMQQQCADTELESYRILRDRIFTANDLEKENVRARWAEALVNFKDTNDERKFAMRFGGICDSIVCLATKAGTSSDHWYTLFMRR